MSDEPIALSMDELQNIMEQGEAGSESESLALDLYRYSHLSHHRRFRFY